MESLLLNPNGKPMELIDCERDQFGASNGISDADYAAAVAAEEAEASELWDRLRNMDPTTEWEWPEERPAAWGVSHDHPLARGLVFAGPLGRPGMVFIGDPTAR